jgi:hypothetical protein
LSSHGQEVVARQPGLRALSADEVAQELSRVEGDRDAIDSALPCYTASVS